MLQQQSPLSPGLGARPGTGEPRAVTANMTSGPQMTSSVRQPLASASPLPRDSGLFIQQDQHSVLNYDPGWYSDVYPIQEGMDSVSMSHLTHPPLPPANTGDQLQHPGSLSCIRQLAESARIHKELADLQVTLCALKKIFIKIFAKAYKIFSVSSLQEY